jgi:hypothetical protein
LIDATILERHTVSIFRAEDGCSALKKEAVVSPKRWYLSMSLYGTETQKNSIIILRHENLKSHILLLSFKYFYLCRQARVAVMYKI